MPKLINLSLYKFNYHKKKHPNNNQKGHLREIDSPETYLDILFRSFLGGLFKFKYAVDTASPRPVCNWLSSRGLRVKILACSLPGTHLNHIPRILAISSHKSCLSYLWMDTSLLFRADAKDGGSKGSFRASIVRGILKKRTSKKLSRSSRVRELKSPWNLYTFRSDLDRSYIFVANAINL